MTLKAKAVRLAQELDIPVTEEPKVGARRGLVIAHAHRELRRELRDVRVYTRVLQRDSGPRQPATDAAGTRS